MFTIDYKSRKPLYQQVIENVELFAAKGILAANSQLPSVRALAIELSINPNTIAKAYNELESRGIIYTLPGRGCFISASPQQALASRHQEIFSRAESIAQEAAHLGIEEQILQQHIHEAYGRANHPSA